MLAKTLSSNVALWYGANTVKTGKVFPANTTFEYSVQEGTWFQIAPGQPSAGLWMNAGPAEKYIVVVPVAPPPAEKTLTNIIEVFNDGSINVVPQ